MAATLHEVSPKGWVNLEGIALPGEHYAARVEDGDIVLTPVAIVKAVARREHKRDTASTTEDSDQSEG